MKQEILTLIFTYIGENQIEIVKIINKNLKI